jgi:hypothetical protein
VHNLLLDLQQLLLSVSNSSKLCWDKHWQASLMIDRLQQQGTNQVTAA